MFQTKPVNFYTPAADKSFFVFLLYYLDTLGFSKYLKSLPSFGFPATPN